MEFRTWNREYRMSKSWGTRWKYSVAVLSCREHFLSLAKLFVLKTLFADFHTVLCFILIASILALPVGWYGSNFVPLSVTCCHSTEAVIEEHLGSGQVPSSFPWNQSKGPNQEILAYGNTIPSVKEIFYIFFYISALKSQFLCFWQVAGVKLTYY